MSIKDLYNLAKQAQTLGVAAIKHVKSGFKAIPEEEKQKRMEICRSCEFIDNNKPENPRCHQCGCFLNIKAGWESESCPIGKWEAIKPQEGTKGCGGCGKTR